MAVMIVPLIPIGHLMVRVSLLPLDFILGDLFGSCAENTFPLKDTLVRLIEEVSQKDFPELLNSNNDDFTIRLSSHSIKLDLAGCQQLTTAALFHAALQCARRHKNTMMDPEHVVEAEEALCNLFQTRELNSSKWFDQSWCGGLALKNLCHVTLERCWRLDQKRLVAWLCLVCPNLKVLNLSHCSHLGISILPQISASCQRLESANLSLYFKRSSPKFYGPQGTIKSMNYLQSGYYESHPRYESLACLTSLSLQGRGSLADNDLDILARCCSNLAILHLGGCFGLTDRGLAKFLVNYTTLTVLEAAHTAFGRLSTEALLQNIPSSDSFALLEAVGSPIIGNCSLTTLDIEGCLGIDKVSATELLSKSFLLKSLNLGSTGLDDRAVLSFQGTSLQELNLRETQVSGNAIAWIVQRNPQLEILNIRGCKRVFSLGLHSSTQSNPLRGLVRKLALGWGLSDFTLRNWSPSLTCVRKLVVGVGGRLSEQALGSLPSICPVLEDLSLCFQVLSDDSLVSLLRNSPRLQSLQLQFCLGKISRHYLHATPSKLTRLSLQRGVEWLTDADVDLLAAQCSSLRRISLVGCRLLTSMSLVTMAQSWRGMTSLELKECGTMTSDGGLCLFACKALQKLDLRHNGLGLNRHYACRALVEMPLLQDLCVDTCDSLDKGYDSIEACARRSLCVMKIIRCKASKNAHVNSTRRCVKDMVLIEWTDNQERIRELNEGV